MTIESRRRAIVVGRYNTDTPELDELVTRNRLEVVFTIIAPTAAKLTALIAVQHILEYDAEVVVLSHLTADEVRAAEPWGPVAELAHILTVDGAWIRFRDI
ncbi:hypothetical protein ACWCPQ_13010 [Nocardia sp. NPDC001965]